MKVTVNFGNIRVIVPCGNGEILVRDLMDLAITRYKKATGKSPDAWVTIHNLKLSSDGGILDPDDKLNDVADDREQIIAIYEEQGSPFLSHNGGDGTSASSVGTESPDIFRGSEDTHHEKKDPYTENDVEITADHISSGVTPLHVRRGSEPALNCISPSPASADPTKRWSAAVIMDNDTSGTSRSVQGNSFGSSENDLVVNVAEDETEEENTGFLRVGQGSERLSILGSGSNNLCWEEAADAQLLRMQDARKEPLGGPGTSPDQSRDRDSESSGGSEDRENPIILKNESGPLGIHVVPDYDSNGRDMGLVVQGVEPGGRIDRDGRLHIGDRIVDINGQSLLHVSFKKAQEIFKDALRDPEIRIRLAKNSLSTGSAQRPKKPPPPVYPKPIVQRKRSNNEEERTDLVEGQERGGLNTKVATVTQTKKIPSSVPISHKNIPLTSNTRKIGRKIPIQLTKGPDGFGFSITTRDNPAGGNCPIYIKNILPKGAAIEDGRLKPGDRLLEVNGIEMTGLSQTEAVKILRNTPLRGIVNLVVSRQEFDPTPSPNLSQELPPDQLEDEFGIYPWKHREILTYNIPLNETGSAGLGVSVKGKTTTTENGPIDLGIFVKSVIHGGAASKDGRLLTNDQLIKINGISLLRMTNTEAMETLRRAMVQGDGPNVAPDAITLTIARQIPSFATYDEDPGTLPSSSSQNNSTVSNINDGSLNRDILEKYTSPLENRTSTPDNSASENSESTVIFIPKSNISDNYGSGSISADFKESKPLGQNPVIERLTGLDTKSNMLRNESYLRASHESWGGNQLHELHGLKIGQDSSINRVNLSPTINLPTFDTAMVDSSYGGSPVRPKPRSRSTTPDNLLSSPSKNGTYSEEKKYLENGDESNSRYKELAMTSQLSLDDESQFTLTRDGFGRQSISEKRHAQLDARNTDTFQRNKRAREEREKQKYLLPEGKQLTDYQNQQEHNHHQLREVCVDRDQETACSTKRPAVKAQTLRANGEIKPSLVRANSAESLVNHVRSNIPHSQPFRVFKEVGKLYRNPLLFYPTCCWSCQSPGCPYHMVPSGGDSINSRGSQVQVGPSLGMKKSSSLESLQTMVQELQKEDKSQARGSRRPTGRAARGRGCNESFRAAVDRSYEGPVTETMETLDEETESSSSAGPGVHGRGSGISSSRDTPSVSSDPAAEETVNGHRKTGKVGKKKGLLKGLGSVFKFGKNKKLTHDQAGKSSKEETEKEEERSRARRAAQEEQERIQEQYRKLVEKQRQEQQQEQTYNKEGFTSISHLPTQTRQERMHQLRAQHQRRHQERQGHYPKDEQEEVYEKEITEAIDRQPRRETEVLHNRSHSFDIYKEMERPGSRVGFADPSKYSHYMNFKEIQQHLQEYRQHQLQNLPRQPQMGKSSPLGQRDRPTSNFFEYESMQGGLQQNTEPNTNSLPRHSNMTGHPPNQPHPPHQHYKKHQVHPFQSVEPPSSHKANGYNDLTQLRPVQSQPSSGALLFLPTRTKREGPGSKV
ncbi:partitioning defective 3 homolog isoform X4 [Limulus polyphemus]|uniref:Partitioning defective 3 homolog isoform X4 n=1 Tax=Limulus polyphemus TaxID=6850 RepID=A0ABM1SXZ4_LIMPO|nr:partitioning defective 3 homolog isoform X4 [Limulus polyphemus]